MKKLTTYMFAGIITLSMALPAMAVEVCKREWRSNNWDSRGWDRGGYFEDYYPCKKVKFRKCDCGCPCMKKTRKAYYYFDK